MKPTLPFYALPFLIAGLVFTLDHAFSQPLTDKQIDSLAKKDMELFQLPGLAIAIIKYGKLVYSKGLGKCSLNSPQLVNSKTLFGIASNTKAFTAAALGLLVDDGKLNWDDKVTQYIPEFKLYDPFATKEMTIRDLLCHRSGLATGAGDVMHDPDSTDFTVKEIIYNLRYLKPVYSFRSKFAYDNNLYLVAGEVIARVSKMTWEEFVQQRILNPLSMDSSCPSYNGCRQSNNIIAAHKKVNDTMRVVTRYSSTKDDAAGGVYSNVDDMSKWLLMFLNNGKYGENLSKQLLSEKTVHELLSPQMLIPVGNGGSYHTHFAAYGLGWFMLDAKGYKQIFHTGEDVGMVSAVSMIPELKLGIIVLTNNESNAIDAITDQITDGYLGVKGFDRSAETYKRLLNSEQSAAKLNTEIKNQLSKEKAVVSSVAKTYTGSYHDQWFGNVTVSIYKNQLRFAAQRSPQLRGILMPYQHDTFFIHWQNPEVDADAFVYFKRGRNGKPSAITIKSAAAGSAYFSDLLFKRVK